MPNSKQIINFDALDYTPVEITKRGRTWTLRDDVPMRVIAKCFTLQNLQSSLQTRFAAHSSDDPQSMQAAVEEALEEIAQATIPLCGDIFRHTLPETSDDDVAAWFSDEERMRIINIFFTHRSSSLTAPQPTPPQKPAPATAVKPGKPAAKRTR